MMQTTPSYEDRPIRSTHPRVIVDAMARCGLDTPPYESLRVLEVGCAHGVNLMAIAARMPRATFVGIDIDAEAIAVASRRAKEAQISNIRFEAADLRAFVAEPESFDLAIAHGVLTWVSPRTGDELFGMFARLLSPKGMAYVSYDTKPGACMREALGLGLRGAADVDGALALLRRGDAVGGTHPGAWLGAEMTSPRRVWTRPSWPRPRAPPPRSPQTDAAPSSCSMSRSCGSFGPRCSLDARRNPVRTSSPSPRPRPLACPRAHASCR